MKTIVNVLFVLFVLSIMTGCGANMFGSSYSRTVKAPGMNTSERRVQGMGTSDTQITENYTGMGMGYGAYGAYGGVGLPGAYGVIPAAPQSYQCTNGNCNTIPYVENRLVRDLEDQHRAIQNLRDIARCQQGNCK